MNDDLTLGGRPRADLPPDQIENSRVDLVKDRDEIAHEPDRPARVPMGQTLNLEAGYLDLDMKNFHHRWILEKDGRIHQAKQAYYEHVMDVDGDKVRRHKGLYQQFLMRLPIEHWESDQKLKHDKQSAKLGAELGKEGLRPGEYIPDGKDHIVQKEIDPLA